MKYAEHLSQNLPLGSGVTEQGERILIPPTAEECAKNHPNAKNFVVEKMS